MLDAANGIEKPLQFILVEEARAPSRFFRVKTTSRMAVDPFLVDGKGQGSL
ncbi:MAG: hypothetical protein AAGE94_20820 [Acidobacteriota bacterium]